MIDRSRENTGTHDPWVTGFAILLAMLWCLTIAVLSTPETANSDGLPHHNFTEMDRGGDGLERHKGLIWSGWMLGSVMIIFFVGLLAWAIGPRGQAANESCTADRLVRSVCFIAGGVLFECVFGMMCLTYWASLSRPYEEFSGPFPTSLSWLMFGIWLCPSVFIAFYVFGFRRWVFPVESERRFRELIDRKHSAK